MIHIWGARINKDLTEGRGPMEIVGYYIHKPDALKRVQGCGVQGVGDGDVIPIQVWETFDECENVTKLRKDALGKLSIAEKKALGLDHLDMNGRPYY